MNANPGTGAATAEVLVSPTRTRDAPVYPRCDSFTLPAHCSSVAQARHRVDERLAAWDIPGAQRDDAALILSELFTNALIHTDSTEITCRVLATLHTLYLSVTDQGHGPTGPQIRHSGPNRDDDCDNAENGRGLLLVSALAHTWGVATNPGHGRTVWAVVNPEEDSRPAG